MTNFKKITSFILVLCMVLALGVFVTSCGGNECTEHKDADTDGKCDACGAEVEIPDDGDDEKTAYTVTLKDANNRPVAGAVVTLTTRNYTSEQLTTDADGKATASLKAVGYVKATVVSVPDGYIRPTGDVQFDDNKTELTGHAISGVLVQICEGGVCQTPVATDADGKAVIRFNPSGEELKARVLNVPTGYTRPEGVGSEGYIHVAAGTTEITLTLIAQ